MNYNRKKIRLTKSEKINNDIIIINNVDQRDTTTLQKYIFFGLV